jgi:hypothetical protein
VGQVVRVDADAVAADQARAERQEVPLGAGGFEHVASVSMPRRLKISASSLIRAMLRSRWVFSMTLAASATLMLDALWVPAVMMLGTAHRRNRRPRGVEPEVTFLMVGSAVLLVAGVDALGAVAGVKKSGR